MIGYVKVAEQDGKKVYTITEEGKKFLSEREETADKIRERMGEWWHSGSREEFEETIHEFRDLGRTFARKAHQINSDKMSRIKGVISQACRDIEKKSSRRRNKSLPFL
jgi:DNA-binding PadR family transcriptional regulator